MTKFSRTLRKHLFTIVVLAVTMATLLFSLFKETSLPQLGHIFSTLDPLWVLLAVGTLWVTWVLEGLCNWLLSRHLYPSWTYGRSFLIGITGIFYNCITPFSCGGQPMQVYYMSKMGMEPGKGAAIISAKTITHQVTMLLFSLFLVVQELPFFLKNVPNLIWFTVFGLGTNILFIVAVLLISVKPQFIFGLLRTCMNGLHKVHLLKKDPEALYQSTVKHLISFQEGFKTMGRDWKLYILVCAITVVQLVLGSFDTYCIYRAFHLHGWSPWLIIAAEVFATMAVALVPLPGGSGGAELSFYAFCKIFFGAVTTPAMLVWRLVTYYGSIIFGYLLVSTGSRRYLGTKPPEVYDQVNTTHEEDPPVSS